VGLFRLLAKEVRIVIHQEIEVLRSAGGVTKVAIAGCVDQIPVPTADRRLLAVRPAGLGRQSVEHEFAYRRQVLGRDRVHIGGSPAESPLRGRLGVSRFTGPVRILTGFLYRDSLLFG